MTTPNDGPLIVLVDDDVDVCMATARLLRTYGYRVQPYASGLSAIAAVDTRHADVIVSDLRMPALGGLALCQRLRREGVTVPFVFITAYDEPGLSDKFAALGHVELLPKPLAADALVAAIDRAIAAGRGGQTAE